MAGPGGVRFEGVRLQLSDGRLLLDGVTAGSPGGDDDGAAGAEWVGEDDVAADGEWAGSADERRGVRWRKECADGGGDCSAARGWGM